MSLTSKKNNNIHESHNTFNLRHYNKELKNIIDELDSILTECSNNESGLKTVIYIRRNRRDTTDFADILLKEQRRLEKLADEILEEYKQKK